ncbi:Lysine-specific demethylase 5A, partial [Balamuthia mandrillaris]
MATTQASLRQQELQGPMFLAEAPTFRPTEEEFADPIKFIQSIRPLAQKYGICRVIPPSLSSSAVASAKTSSSSSAQNGGCFMESVHKTFQEIEPMTMRFTTKLQKVHQLRLRDGPNEQFITKLQQFLEKSGTPMKSVPRLDGKDLDLYKLFKAVVERGGMKAVTRNRRWKEVAEVLKLSSKCTSAAHVLSQHYATWLLAYEKVYTSSNNPTEDSNTKHTNRRSSKEATTKASLKNKGKTSHSPSSSPQTRRSSSSTFLSPSNASSPSPPNSINIENPSPPFPSASPSCSSTSSSSSSSSSSSPLSVSGTESAVTNGKRGGRRGVMSEDGTKYVSFPCKRCGKTVQNTQQSIREHVDYHYALDIENGCSMPSTSPVSILPRYVLTAEKRREEQQKEEEQEEEQEEEGRDDEVLKGEESPHKRDKGKEKAETENGINETTKKEEAPTTKGDSSVESTPQRRSKRKKSVTSYLELAGENFTYADTENSNKSRRGRKRASNGSSRSSKDPSPSSSSEKEKTSQKRRRSNQGRKVVKNKDEEDEEEPEMDVENIMCTKCGGGDDEDKILLCDGDNCDNAYHLYCLRFPLTEVPKGNWLCDECAEKEEKLWMVDSSEDMEESNTRRRKKKTTMYKPATTSSKQRQRKKEKPQWQQLILNEDEEEKEEEGEEDKTGFGFGEGRNFTMATYRKMADMFKQKWFHQHAAEGKPVTIEEAEKEFWRIVNTSEEYVQVHYGSDLCTSTHPSGFPEPAGIPEQDCGWNLKLLATVKGSPLRFLGEPISGVTIPMLYMGMLFSSFCWHAEDNYLYSINYLHYGDPKSWYGIPSKAADLFEQVMRMAMPELFATTPDLLHHIVTMLSPSVLIANGVPVYHLVQYPGDFIITFPQAYHAGFNHGFNCAESVNFATPDWLPFGRKAIQRYRTIRRASVFSHHELLCNALNKYEPESLDMALRLRHETVAMIQEEKELRDKIVVEGIGKCIRMPEKSKDEDNPQCQ